MASATEVTLGALARRWVKMLFGRSYWHAPQGPGAVFVPGKLAGYFCDLRSKTRWRGAVDDRGLPLLETQAGRRVYFPTTLLQKALGHWDRWLESGRTDAAQLAEFRELVDWTLREQDDRGGWPVWPDAGHPFLSDYSAMTQGQAVSVSVRAASLSDAPVDLEAARRATRLMLEPVEAGGVSRRIDAGLVLEEYPAAPVRTILNGWIFALYGLYDLSLVAADPDDVAEPLASTLNALSDRLGDYDAGYWSYYDSAGALASPFYHDLHIVQLSALETTFPELRATVTPIRRRFESYRRSPWKRTRALGVKLAQKLRDRPHLVFR